MIKKTIMQVVVIGISVLIYSCGDNNKDTGNETKTSTNKSSDRSTTKTPEDSMNTNKNNKDTGVQDQSVKTADPIRVNFPAGGNQITLMNYIKGLNDNITYVFEVRKGQKLTASLSTLGGLGNIRFNQIIDPSGNADGPFSNQMNYDFNQSGDWKLVVGESNMLGEPYAGNYKFKIEIK
jgi:hypothetical protein